jgi:pimeloyl-ACP methyl ester carboxylesterase
MQVTQYALPWARQAWLDTLTAMMNSATSDKQRVLYRLSEIKARMLVVWGKQDKRGHLESALKAIKSIPNAELAIMDRCGHMPYMEDPENYNKIVTAFLKNKITA